MKFSQAFGLRRRQAELDFVDVELAKDTPLFVDPFALSIRKDEWSHSCTEHIVSFFQTVIDAIHAGDDDRARRILTNLSEPNETRLGMSKAKPSGRGVSGKQAIDLYKALADSEAARSGILTELAECDLFIPGISTDKVSDMTTNVIRGRLVEYTQKQCELHGIELKDEIPAGTLWSMDSLNWTAHYARLPVWQGEKILLVPKASVRFKMSLTSQEYFNSFVLEFLQAEHLRAGTALVETLRNGRRRVTKESLKKIYPFNKDELYRFTKAHPEVLELYKNAERRERTATSEGLDEDFDEPTFCGAVASVLKAIPTGPDRASDFHNLMIGALEFIFYPNLIYPVKEHEIHSGRKRIDISYTNAARDGFFYRLHTAHQVASNYVMVECKNYTKDVANPELDQIAGRFSVNRGRLGLLIGRSCEAKELFVQRCRDTAQDGRGFVIPLFDDDVYEMLNAIKHRKRLAVDVKLEGIFRRLTQ
jgi:hypothetical protein